MCASRDGKSRFTPRQIYSPPATEPEQVSEAPLPSLAINSNNGPGKNFNSHRTPRSATVRPMNEQDREELKRLKARQERLHFELDSLDDLVRRLDERIATAAAPPVIPEIVPLEITPLEMEERAVPPPLPTIIQTPVIEQLLAAREHPPAPPPTFIPPVMQASPPAPPPPVAEKGSFEMRLGTYWLVRIGIVMLLTGLVFLGGYAYKNYIGLLGAAGKVGLLYAAGGLLLGAGAWLQRKSVKESLQNYGQVLFAGGLAAVYFTTFAAHHFENLKIIDSALLDGALLLGWAALIVWIADRRKSEVLALFALGLAYYTSAITDVGLFTLYSNLVLTIAAVFFLIRNRWTKLSIASLVATYLGFIFWRFHQPGVWGWDTRAEDLMLGNLFLGGYWILFTAGVFLSRAQKTPAGTRASFLTLNNAGFFALIVLSMLRVNHGHFWQFCLGFGAVLLALATLARRTFVEESSVKNAFLTQGLLLVTVGFIAYFTGLKLALILAAESVVLLVLGGQLRSPLLRGGALVIGALAVIWGALTMRQTDADLVIGVAVGVLLAFNAFWSHRNENSPDAPLLRPFTAAFVVFALGIWFATTLHHAPVIWIAPAFALEALALTAIGRGLRLRELTLGAQTFLLTAQAVWLLRDGATEGGPPWWSPAIVITVTLALSHWWQRQRTITLPKLAVQGLQIIAALAVVGMLLLWLHPSFAPAPWLVMTTLLAVALTIYGAVTRFWFLALAGQFALVVSGFEFTEQIMQNAPLWYFPLAPMAALLALATATTLWLARQPASPDLNTALHQATVLYRWVALAMSLAWVCEYVPKEHLVWTFTALGAALFALAGLRPTLETRLASGVFLTAGLITFAVRLVLENGMPSFTDLTVLFTLAALQAIARRHATRWPLPETAHTAMILAAGLGIWAFVWRWVVLKSGGTHFYLTASWAALAAIIFAAGFVLRERMHRWLGLGILAAAVGRVFFSDVWKLDLLYRILSFMALGVVLLVLGFIYNKYQEKIKEWL